MSNKLAKREEPAKKDTLLKVTAFLAGYSAIVTTGVLVFSVMTALSAKEIVSVAEGKANGQVEVVSSLETPSSTGENTADETVWETPEGGNLTEGLLLGDNYTGVFASELADAGIVLREVGNVSEAMGVAYDGKIYTFEDNAASCPNINGIFQFDGKTLDARKKESFEVLKDAGFTSEEDGETTNYFYEKKEDGSSELLISVGKMEAYNENGGTKDCYLAYAYLGDRSAFPDFSFEVQGVSLNGTIKDVLSVFGSPSYVDVYEHNHEGEENDSYILFYYSFLGENNAMNEITFIFLENSEAEKGYVLSEVTTSVF